MIVRPALASRLIYAIAGTGATLGFVGLTTVIVLQGGGAATVFGLFLVAIFALITYWGTRGSVLLADQTMVAYRPAVGKTEQFREASWRRSTASEIPKAAHSCPSDPRTARNSSGLTKPTAGQRLRRLPGISACRSTGEGYHTPTRTLPTREIPRP